MKTVTLIFQTMTNSHQIQDTISPESCYLSIFKHIKDSNTSKSHCMSVQMCRLFRQQWWRSWQKCCQSRSEKHVFTVRIPAWTSQPLFNQNFRLNLSTLRSVSKPFQCPQNLCAPASALSSSQPQKTRFNSCLKAVCMLITRIGTNSM